MSLTNIEQVMPVKLAQALANPLFPALDSALRAGRHIGLDELDNHAFLMDFQDYLEEFYARYNVELIRAPEGFFYLRPRSTTLISRSVLSELDMMVGKILCYLYLSPERLANEGIFTQQELYDELLTLADESRLLKLVNNLIQSTTPKGSHESDPFWTKAETALLQAIILMLFQEAPEYEQNFSMVMRVYLRSVFQQMTVLVYVVDKCLSVLILDGALNVLFDLIIHFAVKTDFPILLRCRSRNGVDLAKNTSCFQAIYILLGIRI